MFTVWFSVPGTLYPLSVCIDGLINARVVWDAMSQSGFYMASQRP